MSTHCFIDQARASGSRDCEVVHQYIQYGLGEEFTIRHEATRLYMKIADRQQMLRFVYLIENPDVPYESKGRYTVSITDDEWKAHYILSTPGARL